MSAPRVHSGIARSESDEAIQWPQRSLDCFASLAMTNANATSLN